MGWDHFPWKIGHRGVMLNHKGHRWMVAVFFQYSSNMGTSYIMIHLFTPKGMFIELALFHASSLLVRTISKVEQNKMAAQPSWLHWQPWRA